MLLVSSFLMSSVACGSDEPDGVTGATEQTGGDDGNVSGGKSLIVYFSRADENWQDENDKENTAELLPTEQKTKVTKAGRPPSPERNRTAQTTGDYDSIFLVPNVLDSRKATYIGAEAHNLTKWVVDINQPQKTIAIMNTYNIIVSLLIADILSVSVFVLIDWEPKGGRETGRKRVRC